jgi:hypothetical protein
VSAGRWNDFVEWARHAREKPTFDVEERDYRLGVAAAVRELIAAGRDGRPLRDPAAAVVEQVLKSVDTVVPPRQAARLAGWAAENERGLARALRCFADAGEDPEARLEAFVAAIESGPGADRFAGGGLIVASLLNFGTSPERLPIVPTGRYGLLPGLLGEEGTRPATPVDAYRRHLAFASKVRSALVGAGVPVRDMLDVESLISLSSAQEEFWARDGDGARPRRSAEPEVYLSICSMYRNEARYLAEWIEFHRLVGVERFFLLDNDSDDESLEVLTPYIEEGIVVRYERPGSAGSQAELDEIKMPGFQHCIDTHGADVRWMAFIDTDEYLFSPTGRPVPELLAAQERWPAVAVNSVFIGASGHVTRPEGLVLENYTKRFETDSARLVKSIVDPVRVTRCVSAHRFEYTHASAVDENGYPVPVGKTKSLSVERLRLNHYFARSEEDVRAKHERRVADRGPDANPLPSSDAIQREHSSGATDEAAMRYLPALRETLARRESGRVK